MRNNSKAFEPGPEHHKLMEDLQAAVPDEMDPVEAMAIVCQFAGHLMVLQSRLPIERALDLASQNMEVGARAASLAAGPVAGNT